MGGRQCRSFFGPASIVIGSFVDRVTRVMLRERLATSTERPRRQSRQLTTK